MRVNRSHSVDRFQVRKVAMDFQVVFGLLGLSCPRILLPVQRVLQLKFSIDIYLQPDGVNLSYFNLSLFDLA